MVYTPLNFYHPCIALHTYVLNNTVYLSIIYPNLVAELFRDPYNPHYAFYIILCFIVAQYSKPLHNSFSNTVIFRLVSSIIFSLCSSSCRDCSPLIIPNKNSHVIGLSDKPAFQHLSDSTISSRLISDSSGFVSIGLPTALATSFHVLDGKMSTISSSTASLGLLSLKVLQI